MKLNKEAYRIKKMIKLITNQCTGSAQELATELGISRSQLFVEIDVLKSMGVDIQFDRKLNSYCLTGNKKVIVREPILIVDKNDLSKINAGFFQKSCSVLFSGLSNATLAFENSL